MNQSDVRRIDSVWCVGCNTMVEETCGGEMCRDCHVSLTFEECVDGTYDVGNLQTLGHSDEELQGLYPDAQQWKKAR